jgi:Flp pilus assembly protein CpaB
MWIRYSLLLISFLGCSSAACTQVPTKQKQVDDKVIILVPKQDLPPYHIFQADGNDLIALEFPCDKLREDIADTITHVDQVKGKTTRHYKLVAREPIYKNDIVDDVMETTELGLKPGELAYTYSLDPQRYAVGQFHPGDRVNLVCERKNDSNQVEKTTIDDVEALTVRSAQSKTKTTITVQFRLSPPHALVLKLHSTPGNGKVDVIKRPAKEADKK